MIKDVGLEDTGQYTFTVEVADGLDPERVLTRDVDLVLQYVRSPHVDFAVTHLSSHRCPECDSNVVTEKVNHVTQLPLYVKGEAYSLECAIEGHPIDTGSMK